MKKNKGVKKVIKIILLCILICTAIFCAYLFIKRSIDKANTNKISNAVNEVSKERVDYVFIEINPSFVLTIKDDKVSDIACLNDDCLSMYDKIDVKGKNIGESIENIYNLAQENGFDTSKGVKVKITNGNINIEEKSYIEVNYINEEEKEELLTNVKNNEEIKNIDNDNYYTSLWNELKKDKDYGKIYNCDMVNEKLECYIMLETGINNESDYDINSESDLKRIKDILFNSSTDVYNTLKKFGFIVSDKKVFISGNWYSYAPLFTLGSKPYKNVLDSEIIVNLEDKYCKKGYAEYQNGKCQIEDGISLILLDKLNLVNPTIDNSNLINNTWGKVDNIKQIYDIKYGMEAENEKCVNDMLAKGYVWKEVYGWEGDLHWSNYMWCIEEELGDTCVAGCDPHAYDD